MLGIFCSFRSIRKSAEGFYTASADQRPIIGPKAAVQREEPETVGIRQIPSCRSITPASGHSNSVTVRWRLFGVPTAAMNSAVPLAPEEP